MRKGVHPIIPFAVVLGIVLVVEYFYVSYFVRSEFIVGRFLRETPIVSEADKLETYVRSFNTAVELSLIQACYESRDQTSSFWYDYTLDEDKQGEIFTEIGSKSADNLRLYLGGYRDFANTNAEEIDIRGESALTNRETNWDDISVKVTFNPITFSVDLESEGIKIDREFNPEARVKSKLKRSWDLSVGLMDDLTQYLEELDLEEIECETNSVEELISSRIDDFIIQTEKDDVDDLYENVKIDYTILQTNLKWIGSNTCCRINVEIELDGADENILYPVYDSGSSSLLETYLGFNLKGKTTNANICFEAPPQTCDDLGGNCIARGACRLWPDLVCKGAYGCYAPKCCCVEKS